MEQACPGQRAPLQGSAFSRPSSCQAPAVRTSFKNLDRRRAGLDTAARLSLGNNSCACFLTYFALISPSCLQTHSLASATALALHVMPGPQSPLLTLVISSEPLHATRCVNFPGFVARKAETQTSWKGSSQTPAYPSASLSRLFHSALHPIIPLAFQMSILHNGKQKPYNAQLPTFHCVLIALLTARSTTQEQ